MRSIRFSKVVRKLSKQSRRLFLTAAIHRRIARRPDFLDCSLSKIGVSFSRRVYALRSKGEASNNRRTDCETFRRALQYGEPCSQTTGVGYPCAWCVIARLDPSMLGGVAPIPANRVDRSDRSRP